VSGGSSRGFAGGGIGNRGRDGAVGLFTGEGPPVLAAEGRRIVGSKTPLAAVLSCHAFKAFKEFSPSLPNSGSQENVGGLDGLTPKGPGEPLGFEMPSNFRVPKLPLPLV
jgi:hypothetical protein